jgi:hypothetical protein
MQYQEDTMTVLRLVLVVLVALIISVPAGMPSQAEALLIGSQGTAASPVADGGIESNDGGAGGGAAPSGTLPLAGATLPIAPNPAWVAPEPGTSWVSHVPGATTPPVPNGTTVDFRENFTLAPGTWQGHLIVHADDSTAVYIDNVLLFALNSTPGTTCAPGIIGCLTGTTGDFIISLGGGAHHFDFLTAQIADVSFGLNYAANLTQVPEPGTILLLGSGLIGLGAALRRRAVRKD